MADYFFHYTSRVVAQMVLADGWLRPAGDSGGLWLSDELFTSAWEAADRLAIPPAGPPLGVQQTVTVHLTKPVEVVCCIPAVRLNTALLRFRGRAGPWRDVVSGRIIYSGGGRQYEYLGPVFVGDLAWVQLVTP